MSVKADSSEQTIIFLHLPKTAGTTLTKILEQQYPAEQIYSIGALAQDGIRKFKRMSVEERRRFRLVIGHLNYGLHQFVPGLSTYFTILREPVDRVISYYYYVRRSPEHYLHEFSNTENMELKTYLESKVSIMMDNFQVRLISGVWNEYPFGECPAHILKLAKRNLSQEFKVIGLTEEFDKTLLLLKQAFGWSRLQYTRQNVTGRRPMKQDLPPDTLQAIASANQLDIELYRYARALFQEQIRQCGPSFSREMRRFQLSNYVVAPLIRFYWQMRKYSVRVFLRERLARISAGRKS
jgi:hypothetical protein